MIDDSTCNLTVDSLDLGSNKNQAEKGPSAAQEKHSSGVLNYELEPDRTFRFSYIVNGNPAEIPLADIAVDSAGTVENWTVYAGAAANLGSAKTFLFKLTALSGHTSATSKIASVTSLAATILQGTAPHLTTWIPAAPYHTDPGSYTFEGDYTYNRVVIVGTTSTIKKTTGTLAISLTTEQLSGGETWISKISWYNPDPSESVISFANVGDGVTMARVTKTGYTGTCKMIASAITLTP